MSLSNSSQVEIDEILKSSRTVAVVGLSSKRDRYSFIVASYLKDHGYDVLPVNPNETEVLGKVAYPALAAVPVPVDVVDIFRRAEEVPAIVEEAIRIGARAIWMQEGIVNEAAAARATEAGLKVVMDRCMRREHVKLHEKGRSLR